MIPMRPGAFHSSFAGTGKQFERPRGKIISPYLIFPAAQALSSRARFSDQVVTRSSARLTANVETLARRLKRIAALDRVKYRYPHLYDDLSSEVSMSVAKTESYLTRKYLAEDCAFKENSNVWHDGPTSFDQFIEQVRRLHQEVDGGSTGEFRRSAVQIKPDQSGFQILFPDHESVLEILGRLWLFINDNRDLPKLLIATILYVGIIHAHPFSDGNGRTARLLFNLCLRQHFVFDDSLPMEKIASIDPGAFLIKLRRSIYGGEWEPLLLFFQEAWRLWADVASERSE